MVMGLEMTVPETTYIAHAQYQLLMQCLAVRHYCRRLAERKEGKLAHCELTAAAVDIIAAKQSGSVEDKTDSAEGAEIETVDNSNRKLREPDGCCMEERSPI